MGLQMDYKTDDVILRERGVSHYMYLILEGSVALFSNYGTKEEYLYGLLGKGKTFGEMGLLTGEESGYTVVAISDVKVAVFSEKELGSFIRGYPDYALGVMRSIVKMNSIYRINLKMLMEENKDYVKYKKLYEDVIKQDTDMDVEVIAKWRSSRK